MKLARYSLALSAGLVLALGIGTAMAQTRHPTRITLDSSVASMTAASQPPVPVLATGADERYPAATDSFLAWAEAPKLHPHRFNVYVRPHGRPRFKANVRGTVGFVGAGAIDGTTLVYAQRPSFHAQADLKFLDLTTRTRSNPPGGVNTEQPEGAASLAGNWLLFSRGTPSTFTQRIILFNLATHKTKQLAVARGASYAQPGIVEGNYASWIECRNNRHCNAYVYDIAARSTRRLPNPLRRSQYAVAVTAAGVVYFAESRNINCGRDAALWRYPLGGTRTKLLSFPHNRDVADLDPVVNGTTTTLFYDRFHCRTDTADIFKLALGPQAIMPAYRNSAELPVVPG